ncbi:MAG: thioredoxin family protein [Limnochordia bacterium]|jgi:predicted thioredoxin/glutaredoxin|nr:thioredoxin family protein [Bacillota bacterium]
MEVKVFGVEGCSSCDRLFRTLQHIAAELGNVQVDKENDLGVALTYGLRVPPGIAIDGELVVKGRFPDREELWALLASRQI